MSIERVAIRARARWGHAADGLVAGEDGLEHALAAGEIREPGLQVVHARNPDDPVEHDGRSVRRRSAGTGVELPEQRHDRAEVVRWELEVELEDGFEDGRAGLRRALMSTSGVSRR